MADIKIKHTRTIPLNSEETTIEVTGVEYGADTLTKSILEALGTKKDTPETGELLIKGEDSAELVLPPQPAPTACNFRMFVSEDITPEDLKTAKEEGNIDEVVSPYDEIDIPLDTGGSVTVVCAYSDPNTARFVFKDCWDEAVMNDEATNKGGYYKSKGRAHVLVDILPHIAQEWRELMKPRKMVEEIDGERLEYADLMWLPSATDMFGTPENCWWNDLDDSFQLPIFQKERERVKECGDEGTYPYWLRSVYATYSYTFCRVSTDGGASYSFADISLGFASGFDI